MKSFSCFRLWGFLFFSVYFNLILIYKNSSQVALVVKNLPVNVGEAREMGVIPGSGRSLGTGNGNPLWYSCLKIPRTEEPGGLQSMESQRVGHNRENEREMGLIISLKSCIPPPNQHHNQAIKYLQFSR